MPTGANRQRIVTIAGYFRFGATEKQALRFVIFVAKGSKSEESMAAYRSGFKLVTVAAAAGLLWSQAASAAVPLSATSVDPLVALSALGTTGSSSAVCVANAQASIDGCVLAMNDVAQPADTQAPPPPPPEAVGPPPPPPQFNILPLLLGLAAFIAVAAIIASGKSHGSGDLRPVSPA